MKSRQWKSLKTWTQQQKRAHTKAHTAEESETSATEESTDAKVCNDKESEVPLPEENVEETDDEENKTMVPEITEITFRKQLEDEQSISVSTQLRELQDCGLCEKEFLSMLGRATGSAN